MIRIRNGMEEYNPQQRTHSPRGSDYDLYLNIVTIRLKKGCTLYLYLFICVGFGRVHVLEHF